MCTVLLAPGIKPTAVNKINQSISLPACACACLPARACACLPVPAPVHACLCLACLPVPVPVHACLCLCLPACLSEVSCYTKRQIFTSAVTGVSSAHHYLFYFVLIVINFIVFIQILHQKVNSHLSCSTGPRSLNEITER